MYQLNERQGAIILDLLESKKPITAKSLSYKYKVSIRTIRYDIVVIDLWLNENLIELMKKQKTGFWLSITQEEKINLKSKLKLSDCTIKVFSRNERKKIIISELLKSSEPLNSDYICDKLGVSKTTLLGDVSEIRNDLISKDIFIVGKTGVGYILEGDEKNIRELIGNMLSNDLDSNQLLEMLNKDTTSKSIINVLREDISLNSDIDIGEIKHAIKMSKQIFDFWVPDSSYISLILHIAIAIDRLKNNQEINLSSKKVNLLKTYKEYVLAKEIAFELEKSFNISIPDAEIANITFHLISANLKLNYLQSDNIYDIKSTLLKTLEKIMEYLRSKLILPENSFDKLKMDLLSHLKLSMKKIELNIQNTNPLLEQIKKDYGQYFTVAKGIIPIFYNEMGTLLDENEISYITLYIAAQCELNSGEITKNVLIVCTTGKGLAKILSARIKKNFSEIVIKDTPSIFELEEGNIPLEDIDFIISTLQISNVNVPVLKISPILTEEDLALIKSCIYQADCKRLPHALRENSYLHDSTMEAVSNIGANNIKLELRDGYKQALDFINNNTISNSYSEGVILNHMTEEIALIMVDIGQILVDLKEYIDDEDIILKIWGVGIHILMAIPRWRVGQVNNDFVIEDITTEQQNICNVVNSCLDNIAAKYNLNISLNEKFSIAKYFFKEVINDR